MKVTYDKNDLKSVLEAIRDELGKPIFRDAVRMYGVICDFAPELSAEAGVLRKLSEKGMLSELERAAGLGNGVVRKWDSASPTVRTVLAVADYLGVTLDELVRPRENVKISYRHDAKPTDVAS